MRKQTKVEADVLFDYWTKDRGLVWIGNRRDFYRWYNKWLKSVVDECFRMYVIERSLRG